MGVLITRILLFRVLYSGPLFSETPKSLNRYLNPRPLPRTWTSLGSKVGPEREINLARSALVEPPSLQGLLLTELMIEGSEALMPHFVI